MVIWLECIVHLVLALRVEGSTSMTRKNKGVCECGRPQRSKGKDPRNGEQIYDRQCWKCKEGGYRLHKRTYCEHCGFIALHPVQLDVDHIDGNRKNNNLENLQTLCANCHRLKTQINNDHLKGRDA